MALEDSEQAPRYNPADTVIYLDVDGVLNPWRAKQPWRYWGDYRRHEVRRGDGARFKMWFSESMGRAITRMAARTGAEIVWSTSWGKHIERVLVPISGMPAGLRALSYPKHARRDTTNTGKLPSVMVDAQDRPVVWVDDAMGPADLAWATERTAPTLLIKPSPWIGLRPEDIEFIEEWIDNLAGRQGRKPKTVGLTSLF